MSIPLKTVSQIAEQCDNPFFGQASVYLQETWTCIIPQQNSFLLWPQYDGLPPY
ncbi:MAG: hypothetical protein QGH37_06975 [Candidatus Poribacteria bacterium]|jgi:hypothetical protein|nr:hypothetical protein [Candidatus Poribacteria bacterium]MDP6961319.1 hypothetical protein [Dehalococcoidia bacterium]